MNDGALFASVVMWYSTLFVLGYEIFLRRADRSRVAIGGTTSAVPTLSAQEVVLEETEAPEVLVA